VTACLPSALRFLGPAGSLYSFLVVPGPSSAAQQLSSSTPSRHPPTSSSITPHLTFLHPSHPTFYSSTHEPRMHTRLEWRHLDHTIHIHTIHSTNNTVFSLVMPSGLLGAAPQISNSCCNPSIASIQYPHSSSSLISGPSYLQALKRSTPPKKPPEFLAAFFLFSVSSVPVPNK